MSAVEDFLHRMSSDTSTVLLLLLLLIGLGLYFLPTIVAVWRIKRNTASIATVNLFLGWSFVGWVVALAWAFAENGHLVISHGKFCEECGRGHSG